MKKFTSLMLAAAMLFALCACGGNTTADNSDTAVWQEQYDLGVRYLSEGNYEEAIIAFTAAIEIDPKQAPAYIGRADAYIGSGETAETLAAALVDYKEAVKLDETNPGAYLGLADMYIRMGEYDRALEVLREGLEKTGNNEDIAGRLAEIESGNYYDSFGRIRRTNGYDGGGNLIWYHTYAYDGQGRGSAITSFDAAGSQTGHVDFAYDDRGNQTVGYHQAETGAVQKREYAYDEAGNCVRETWYHADGTVNWSNAWEYDANGNRVRETRYGADGSVANYQTMEYNESGLQVRETAYNADGSCYGFTTIEYNGSGKVTQRTWHNADGTVEMYFVFEYDSAGNQVRMTRYGADGAVQEVVEYN